MENYKPLRDSQIVLLGVCIVVATVAASLILAQGIFKVVQFNHQQITVTGSAQREITSDLAVWRGRLSRRDTDLKTAYQNLRIDMEKVRSYLISKGVPSGDIVISQVSTESIYAKNDKGSATNDIEAYRLFQAVDVRSSDVNLVTSLSRESTELIDQGVEFESDAPQYFYSKLDDLKVEMLAKATENAKERAANMTRATGNGIGLMRQAKMGVFQITPSNSTEVSDWGVNDTSSLYKKVTAVVNVSFAIQ
jgi:uncharacterized protein